MQVSAPHISLEFSSDGVPTGVIRETAEWLIPLRPIRAMFGAPSSTDKIGISNVESRIRVSAVPPILLV